jgi:hypothetical protein
VKEEFDVRTSNLLVYHYDGREINRLTARLFLFLLVFPGGKAAAAAEEEGRKRRRKRERDVITSTSNPNRSEQRSSFVVHNWRAYESIASTAYLLD